MYFIFFFALFRPRSLDIPGADLKGVCLLRSPEDGNAIAETTKDKNVVIVGTSFIGENQWHFSVPASRGEGVEANGKFWYMAKMKM